MKYILVATCENEEQDNNTPMFDVQIKVVECPENKIKKYVAELEKDFMEEEGYTNVSIDYHKFVEGKWRCVGEFWR